MTILEQSEVWEGIESAFSKCQKPHFFTDVSHCSECAEHNKALSNSNRDTIGLKELGNPCWDPICFVKPKGFLYYFPAMVRLAFDDSTDNEYLDQLLFHCSYEGSSSITYSHFSNEQVKATADLMRFLTRNWKEKLDNLLLTKESEKALKIWGKQEKERM